MTEKEFPVHKKKDLRVELRAAADLALPALFWRKAGWRVSASWKIMLISQGVKRKRSQPATTSSRCREVHIFLRRGDEGSARPFQHARTLHDVAILPLAMASARWAFTFSAPLGLPLCRKAFTGQKLLRAAVRGHASTAALDLNGDFVPVCGGCHAALRPTAWTSASRSSMTR
jgi:hypothetical protein